MLDRKTRLAKNVGQGALSECFVHRHDSSEDFLRSSFLERDVAALLAQFDKSGPLQCADKSLAGNARELRHLSRDFNDRPEGLFLSGHFLGTAPSLEIDLDGLAEIRSRGFDAFALGRNVEFRTAGDVEVILFGDQCGEAVRHVEMLSEGSC